MYGERIKDFCRYRSLTLFEPPRLNTRTNNSFANNPEITPSPTTLTAKTVVSPGPSFVQSGGSGRFRRIKEANRFMPLERLALSPQCGFASSIVGNEFSIEDERRKLERVCETARRIWT